MPISFRFHENKAAAAASLFLSLAGGEMDYMPLLKLMYLADRLALDRLGRPISGDQLVSMKHGPVLSQTYNLMKDIVREELVTGRWGRTVGRAGRYRLRLVGSADALALSQAEAQIIAEVFQTYGAADKWALRDHTHTACPEWEDPGDSSNPIEIEQLLRYLGKTEDEIAEVRENAEQEAGFDAAFA
jgi:uncharacterized phage-associated protein